MALKMQKGNKDMEKDKDKKVADRRKSGGTGLNDLFIGVFGIAFLLSLSLNVLHASRGDELLSEDSAGTSAIHRSVQEFKVQRSGPRINRGPADQEPVDLDDEEDEPPTDSLAQLDCSAHGGPDDAALTQEMVYWHDIPSDAEWVSPFYHRTRAAKGHTTNDKYLTFEPDGGGWNNIRMSMESVVALAVAMGRTLVMPPQKHMYLLGKNDNKQRHHFDFADFFPLYEIAEEHLGLNIITMEEFLEREALAGNLINSVTGKPDFPPGNRTNWDGLDQNDYDTFRFWLRNVTRTANWKPGVCLPAFPQSGDHKDIQVLQDLAKQAKKANDLPDGKPVPVNTPNTLARLEETLAQRHQICVYHEQLQKAGTVHFQMNHKEGFRLLVHFYAFLFFEDWKEDLWMKRFIRDHVRYTDPIQCAAARLVNAVREHARNRDPTNNPDGLFDGMHIRRGDFQFKDTRIPAEEIYQNIKDEMPQNTTIFIATDERDKSFFDPLREHYDLLFLDDFKHELEGVNTNYYGMVDQLVSSRGRNFFGCWHSTFTGYIIRIRGYHSQNLKEPGWKKGELPTTYYYATPQHKFDMLTYSPIKGAYFNREFPTSWRDIHKSIGKMRSNPISAE